MNREIDVADAEKQTVIPLPDVINLMSLFATVGGVIVLPLATESHFWFSQMVLGSAYVLIAFYPLAIAAHFRLWRRNDTRGKDVDGANPSYANREELAVSFLSVLIAMVVAGYLGMH